MKQLSPDSLWYGTHPARWLLWPFSWLYRVVIALRRFWLIRFGQTRFDIPVIVIGNLTVGGAGKTPLVAALARYFSGEGYRVGIASRGYGATVRHFPHTVSVHDDAGTAGDEPLLLARKTGCPVVIAPKRVDAVYTLIREHGVNLVLSDDGLQHYAMGRTVEIVVVDGERKLGNEMCLPAGPLREPKSRLNHVDMIVVNGGDFPGAFRMRLEPGPVYRLSDKHPVAGGEVLPGPVAAVAGIANPGRFFAMLQRLGIQHCPYPFPDHHPFVAGDLRFAEPTVLMTEKDAVKCESLAVKAPFSNAGEPLSLENMFCLPVEAKPEDGFWQALEACLSERK